jgi:hypothetical protein
MGWRKLFGAGILCTMIIVSIAGYYARYYTPQKHWRSEFDSVALTVKTTVPPEDIILVFGLDWSSELPYYAERRAVMWPGWMSQDMDSMDMKKTLNNLGDTRIGALVICDSARADPTLVKRATNILRIAEVPKYRDSRCTLYAPEFGR